MYAKKGGRPLIAAGLICSAFVIAGSAAMPSFFLTAAIFSLLGITMGFALTPMLPLLSDLYGGAGSSRGLVYGIYNTLFSFGLAIGPLAGELLVASFTFRLTVFGHALLLAISGVGAYLSIGQLKSA